MAAAVVISFGVARGIGSVDNLSVGAVRTLAGEHHRHAVETRQGNREQAERFFVDSAHHPLRLHERRGRTLCDLPSYLSRMRQQDISRRALIHQTEGRSLGARQQSPGIDEFERAMRSEPSRRHSSWRWAASRCGCPRRRSACRSASSSRSLG